MPFMEGQGESVGTGNAVAFEIECLKLQPDQARDMSVTCSNCNGRYSFVHLQDQVLLAPML